MPSTTARKIALKLTRMVQPSPPIRNWRLVCPFAVAGDRMCQPQE